MRVEQGIFYSTVYAPEFFSLSLLSSNSDIDADCSIAECFCLFASARFSWRPILILEYHVVVIFFKHVLLLLPTLPYAALNP